MEETISTTGKRKDSKVFLRRFESMPLVYNEGAAPALSRSTRNKKERGFTFIELILVILIIAVIAALATPIFRRTFSGLQLKNSAFNISKIINYAEEMAIIEKFTYKVNFDFDEGKYWITRLDSWEEGSSYKRIGGRYGRIFKVPRGLKIEGRETGILAFPDGTSDGGYFKVLNNSGQGYSVKVTDFGKRVEVKEIDEN